MAALFSSLGTGPASLYSMLFNALIILAIGGLWLMWARNLNRLKGVETLLMASSEQLEEASKHLESALHEINRLQNKASAGNAENRAASEKTAESSLPEKNGSAGIYSPSGMVHRGDPLTAPPQHEETRGTTHTHPQSIPAKENSHEVAPQIAAKRDTPTPDQPGPEDDVHQILRRHGLGISAETIAREMNAPLARVKLLLRLHEKRAPGQRVL
ncbi:MAG: hypothetical protein Q9M30_01860 [Mariprofundaceae bacterium]|nr:hypothetical protein [Mariprofundaceae bacterium]